MDTQERVAHWIRPNESVRVPRRNIFLHAIARSATTKDGSVKTWGIAVATFVAAAKGRKRSECETVFTVPSELWRAVADFTREGARTVLWAHNLGYDLRLADALHILPRLGWELAGHNLAPRGTWLAWRNGKRTLTLVDLSAVFPKLLPEIAKAFQLTQPPKAVPHESAEHALARCKAGHDVVKHATTTYLQWIEDEELGNWQLTGSGQSYAAFRHKFLTHPMLVHDDVAALKMEREAMWTGRCEAYWHGTLLRQVVDEWDFTSSYASICEEVSLPTKLIGPMPTRYPWRRIMGDDKVAMLARVTVDTPEPVVPTRRNGRILWPIGIFDTTLWDVEIDAAIKAGATVTVHEGFLYRKAPALKEWAEWILDKLVHSAANVPAWQKIIIKHWSTAAIGRFGMMFPMWEELGTARLIGVDRRVCVDADTGDRYDLMQVGRTLFRQGALTEWQHSMPAITGYVMACARIKLWDLMRAMPPNALLYVDTDSILVTDMWRAEMATLASSDRGRGLRLKKSWDGFSIYGPRQIITGAKVRVSGVPSAARRIDRHTFDGEVWEQLATSLSNRRADRIVTRDRRWHAKGVDNRRTGHGVGWTTPIQIGREP